MNNSLLSSCYYWFVEKLITEAVSIVNDAGEPKFWVISLETGAKRSAKMDAGIIFRS